MIGVEQENQVERLHRCGIEFVILERMREHHVQEVGRVFIVRLGIDDRQPARRAIGERSDRANLRDEPRGLQVKRGFYIR